jgi:D-inositol-3-phosphate glycosyltransferase
VRIALVSEHASPLAAIGGVDGGGQNVHVAELATGLVRLGHGVAVYTRRYDADLAERVRSPGAAEWLRHRYQGPDPAT